MAGGDESTNRALRGIPTNFNRYKTALIQAFPPIQSAPRSFAHNPEWTAVRQARHQSQPAVAYTDNKMHPFSFFIKAPKAPNHEPGILEDFSYGWNKETTFDIYKKSIEAILSIASAAPSHSDDQQVFLRTVIVLLVSGIESLVKFKLSPGKCPRQSLKCYNRALRNRFPKTYQCPTGRDQFAIQTMFEARHAIVHNGCRVTQDLKKSANLYPGQKIELDVNEVNALVEVVSTYANMVYDCS